MSQMPSPIWISLGGWCGGMANWSGSDGRCDSLPYPMVSTSNVTVLIAMAVVLPQFSLPVTTRKSNICVPDTCETLMRAHGSINGCNGVEKVWQNHFFIIGALKVSWSGTLRCWVLVTNWRYPGSPANDLFPISLVTSLIQFGIPIRTTAFSWLRSGGIGVAMPTLNCMCALMIGKSWQDGLRLQCLRFRLQFEIDSTLGIWVTGLCRVLSYYVGTYTFHPGLLFQSRHLWGLKGDCGLAHCHLVARCPGAYSSSFQCRAQCRRGTTVSFPVSFMNVASWTLQFQAAFENLLTIQLCEVCHCTRLWPRCRLSAISMLRRIGLFVITSWRLLLCMYLCWWPM